MSSKASATVLLILEESFRFPKLQPLQEQFSSTQLHSFITGNPLLALIFARHLPVKMLLTLIEPAALKKHNLLVTLKTVLSYQHKLITDALGNYMIWYPV